MKICWDNLEKLRYSKRSKKWYTIGTCQNPLIEMEVCKKCGFPYLVFEQQFNKGKGQYCSRECSSVINGNLQKFHTTEAKNLMSKKRKGKNHYFFGKNLEKSSNWKGGVTKNNIPLYNTYAHQISFAEQVRRNKEDENIIEVKCTYCGQWYIPKLKEIARRVQSLNGKTTGENRLYCSNECKQECPIYRKQRYSAEETNTKRYSREVQPELRQMVFERDNWTCQNPKCKNKKNLHCHHKEGIRWEPLESADIDKCITFCKTCHGEAHEKEGCRPIDMRCEGVLYE